MRFGQIHRVLVDALAILGILAVVSATTMAPVAAVAALVGACCALFVPDRWQRSAWATHVATVAPLALLSVEGVRLFTAGSVLEVAIEFAVMLQAIRLATRRGATHDQQIIVLALLHFVVGTVLGGGIAFGLCFIGFVVVAPGALALSHLRREVEGNYRQGARDRTGLPVDVPRILRSRRVVGRGFLLVTTLMSVPIFLFTAILFLAFPRVGLSLLIMNHGRGGRMVGFSDHVDLGDVGQLRSDPTIALRFEPDELPAPRPARMTLRFRGTAFDTYDGRAWSRSHNERATAERVLDTYPITRYPNAHDTRIRIDLEPIDPPVVFLPTNAVALQISNSGQQLAGSEFSLQRGPEDELRYANSETRGLRYYVHFAQNAEPVQTTKLAEEDRRRYLTLAPGQSSALESLAQKWTQSAATPALRARALESHLKEEYAYDIASPSGAATRPVEHFLLESKRGHCEFFSTSMALLLRTLNIPSRNATGLVGGTYNRFGNYYAVREGDAHSWVEAFIESEPGVGYWTTFDPTPSTAVLPPSNVTSAWNYARDFAEAVSQRWNRNVVGYDLQQQGRVAASINGRFNSIRARLGIKQGTLERLTRTDAIALYVIIGTAIAAAVWHRRKRHVKSQNPNRKQQVNQQKSDVSALYRELEKALASQGHQRRADEAPLRHATQVAAAIPQLATCVENSVQCYLDVRFGGSELTKERTALIEQATKEVIKFGR
jgi:protein-glutamine gamma-glutamyltransferase